MTFHLHLLSNNCRIVGPHASNWTLLNLHHPPALGWNSINSPYSERNLMFVLWFHNTFIDNLTEHLVIQWLFTLGFVLSSVIDTMITCSLLFLLNKNQMSSFRSVPSTLCRMDYFSLNQYVSSRSLGGIIDTAIHYTLETGSLTASVYLFSLYSTRYWCFDIWLSYFCINQGWDFCVDGLCMSSISTCS